MLRWSLIFFLIALISAVLGFTGIAAAAAERPQSRKYLGKPPPRK